jgi:PAS domain S-box-containing protein
MKINYKMANKNLLKILFVEDVGSDVELAVIELQKERLKFEYKTVCTGKDLIDALKEFRPDLIISDYMMSSFDGLQALKIAKESDAEIPFILCTGSINEETAVACIKAGAKDYILKDQLSRLPFAVKEVLEQIRIKKEKRAADLLLLDTEEKLQSIFSAAPVGIGLLVNGKVLEVNDTFCEMTGYGRSELIGKNGKLIFPAIEDFEPENSETNNQITGRFYATHETKFKSKNGNILNIILNTAPLDRNDLSKGFSFTALDITVRKQTEVALRESEERFRTLYNDAIVGLYRTTPNGEILLVNSTLIKMLGFQSSEDLTSKNIKDAGFGPSYDRRQFIDQIERDGEIKEMEAIWICRNGKKIFVRESAKAIRDFNGKILYFDGTVEDITERKRAEKELESSYSILNASLESTADGILIVDGNGSIIKWNQKFAEMWGIPATILDEHDDNTAINHILNNLRYPDDFLATVRDLYANPEKSSFEKLDFKDGRIFERYSQPQKIDNKVVGRVWSFRDVTERYSIEKSLKLSEEKYRTIFENVQDLFFETSIDGTIIEISPSIEILSKGLYRREELIGKSMYDFYSDPYERSLLLTQIKKNESVSDFEITLINRDGSRIPCSISCKIWLNAQGDPEKLIGSMRDITDRKKASEALKLGKEKAEASDKLKTTFLNNISHEVRTPLNGILGFAEIMSQPDLSEEERTDSLSMLHTSSERLLNTMTNYMDISLIASGNMSVYKKEFVPGRLLRKIFDSCKAICLKKNLELILKIPKQSETLSINSDSEIFQKIISHLINNAIKFTEKGSIILGFIRKESELEFFVKDTGVGIGKESLEIVFDNFAKEDRGPIKLTEGSGLGLSIAKGMIDILGGNIKVESEIGVGSCFSFTIPYMKKNEKAPTTQSGMEHKKIIKGGSILVAEDDETNYFYLKAILTRETDLKILHASNGREAIELVKTNPGIVIILMDMKMPDIDGFEATRQIKLINKDIPVIGITAYAMSGDEERVLGAGCDGYLSKPINRTSLLEKMAELIKI